MTAQDAFAIAFDEFVPQEAWAMDKKGKGIPAYQQKKQNKTFGANGSAVKSGAKAPSSGSMGSMGGGMGGMGGGMGGKPRQEQSLAEHMAQYHKEGFDPRVNKCKLYDALKKNFERQGLSPQEAEKKALAAHNASGYVGVANRQQPQQGSNQPQPQSIDDAQATQIAEQMYQQFMAKPSAFAIEQMAKQSILIQPPMTMQDANGEDVKIEDTFQLACMRFLQDQRETSGDASVENAAEKAQNQMAEITSGSGVGDMTSQQPTGEGAENDLTPIKPPPTPVEYYKGQLEQAQAKLQSAKTDEERAAAQEEVGNAARELEASQKLEAEQPQQTQGEQQNPSGTEGQQGVEQTQGDQTQQIEQPQQTRTISSSSGKSSRPMTAEESQIIAGNPEKEETLRKIVDLEEKASDASLDEGELQDLSNAKKQFERMFYGRDVGETEGGNEKGNGEGNAMQPDEFGEISKKEKELYKKVQEAYSALRNAKTTEEAQRLKEEYDKARAEWEPVNAQMLQYLFRPKSMNTAGDGAGEKPSPTASATETPAPQGGGEGQAGGNEANGGEATNPDGGTNQEQPQTETPSENPEGTDGETEGGGDNPPPTPSEQPEEEEAEEQEEQVRTTPTRRNVQPPAPSDEQFRTKNGKLKVNGMVYNDLSGQGLLHGLFSAFMAGLHGEGIITGWDKISGKWDQMKRSANGENVRSGITDSLLSASIGDYVDREDLSDDARMEIGIINDMYSQAKTPKQKMSAVKEFQKWKEKYKEELGEIDNPTEHQIYKPLPNEYKGSKPPLSILSKSDSEEADKAYGETIADDLFSHLTNVMSLPVEGVSDVSVGPESSTISLKVSPTFDLAKVKNSRAMENMTMAIGAEVVKVEADEGKKGQVSITIKNPKMRVVGFTEIASSKEWQDFSEEASLPMIVGKDSRGKSVMKDMAKMPHMIVTGASGTGKSVFVKSVLSSIQMAKTPKQARIALIDPKNEFRTMDGSPFLMYPRAGGDSDTDKKAESIANVVESLKKEMEERITKIGGVVRGFDPTKNEYQGDSEANIKEYNESHKGEELENIIMIFDEFANMSKNPRYGKRITEAIDQLTALGRSVGIHCMLITQRDDKDSIPHKIQSNAKGRIHFKAAPGDTKAGKEYQNLSGDGAYIMSDGDGKETRGRGSFISKKDFSAIPAYYRSQMNGETAPSDDNEENGSESESTSLPEDHYAKISDAINDGLPVSMEADEGYMDAFKSAFPDDWEITEEETDGKKYWRASPPKPKEESKPDSEEKSTETDWRKLGSREEMVEAIDKEFETQKAKAKEAYLKGKDSEANQKKYEQAIEDAEADRARKMRFVDSEYPPKIEEFGEGEHIENEDNESNDGEETEEEDENLAMFDTFSNPGKELERGTASMKKKIAELEKAVQKGEISSDEAEEQVSRLKELYMEAKQASKQGGATAKQIREILKGMDEKPKSEKPTEEVVEESNNDTWESPFDASQKPENRIAAARAEFESKAKEIDKDRSLSVVKKSRLKKQLQSEYDSYVKSVKEGKSDEEIYNDTESIKAKIPTKRKGKPIVGATHILRSTRGTGANVTRMPREIADNVKLPSGFEIDSDEQGNPLWIDGKYGFARDQRTGMYGKVYPDSRFVLSIDPTNPEFKGIDSPEAKAAYKAWMRNDREKNPKKDDELRKRYNLISRGVPTNDMAPDNRTIVANAILEAIAKVGIGVSHD